jgi:hypothetical protein
MTRRVLKWRVPADDHWHPVGSGQVVLVDVQPRQVGPLGTTTVWTLETTDSGDPSVVAARIFGTGQEVPDDVEHVGSCIDGPLVWHVFRSDQEPPARPRPV